jgi:hypothetical protein
MPAILSRITVRILGLAAFIFGASLGDPLCDAIVELLRGNPDGATRTEISEHFDRNKTKAQLDAALAALQSKGVIRSSQRATGGRAAEVWQLVAALLRCGNWWQCRRLLCSHCSFLSSRPPERMCRLSK